MSLPNCAASNSRGVCMKILALILFFSLFSQAHAEVSPKIHSIALPSLDGNFCIFRVSGVAEDVEAFFNFLDPDRSEEDASGFPPCTIHDVDGAIKRPNQVAWVGPFLQLGRLLLRSGKALLRGGKVGGLGALAGATAGAGIGCLHGIYVQSTPEVEGLEHLAFVILFGASSGMAGSSVALLKGGIVRGGSVVFQVAAGSAAVLGGGAVGIPAEYAGAVGCAAIMKSLQGHRPKNDPGWGIVNE